MAGEQCARVDSSSAVTLLHHSISHPKTRPTEYRPTAVTTETATPNATATHLLNEISPPPQMQPKDVASTYLLDKINHYPVVASTAAVLNAATTHLLNEITKLLHHPHGGRHQNCNPERHSHSSAR
jgi:hypothetical protein